MNDSCICRKEDANIGCEENSVPEVSINVDLYGENISWIRKMTSSKSARSTIQPRDICRKAEQMSNDDNIELPILIYFGANRELSWRTELVEKLSRKQYFRTVGYEDALLDNRSLDLLYNWCIRMEQISWQKQMKIAEYEAVKKAVADFMNIMKDDMGNEIFFDKHREELMYKKDGQTQAIMQLDTWYQDLIWMVFEIAYRMAVLNPVKKDCMTETSGVVLIDEINRYAEGEVVERATDAFRKVFPNVQFIASMNFVN